MHVHERTLIRGTRNLLAGMLEEELLSKRLRCRKEEAVKVRRGEGHGNNQKKKKRKKCEVYECEVSDEGGQHLAAPSVKSSL